MREPPSDSVEIFVAWALLPVTIPDGQECPSYNGNGAIDAHGSRLPVSFSNGSSHDLQFGGSSLGTAPEHEWSTRP